MGDHAWFGEAPGVAHVLKSSNASLPSLGVYQAVDPLPIGQPYFPGRHPVRHHRQGGAVPDRPPSSHLAELGLLRFVRKIRAQPTLHILQFAVLARRVVGDLIFADLADCEIARLGMREIQPANRGRGHHGLVLR